MMKKQLFKVSTLLLAVGLLLIGGCKEEKNIFEIKPSDGIFLTPTKTGVTLEDVTVTLSSTPFNIHFGAALYKDASEQVNVTLGLDLSLVEDFNKKNGTNYTPLPNNAASLSDEKASIEKGNRSTDTLAVTIRPGLLDENTTYLLPLRIKQVTGGNIKLDQPTTIRYYAIKGQLPNIAKGKITRQSTTNATAVSDRAVDGNINGAFSAGSVSHTMEGIAEQWWEVDLGGKSSRIKEINLYNRTDCCGIRLSNYYVFVSDVPFSSNSVAGTLAQSGVTSYFQTAQAGSPTKIPIERAGRYVRIQLSQGTLPLAIAEVEVLGIL